MAATETYERNHLYNLNLADLQPDPNQPRKYLDAAALNELTASIAQHGVLEPILFRQESGLLYIVAGERRVAAARKAGLSTIPAIFIDGQNPDEISIVENILRQDLTLVEEAEALDRLMKDHNYMQDDLARILSKAKSTISETLSLTRLPKVIRDECRKDPSIPKKTLVGIASKKTEQGMLTEYQKYKDKINPKDKTDTANKVSKVQSTINSIDHTAGLIRTLNIRVIAPEEIQGYVNALQGLKNTTDAVLAVALQPVPEDADEQTPSSNLA
jgi:ParB family transcriptional regulator, chromosome partitioning protein